MRIGRYRVKLIAPNYHGHGKRWGVIRFGNGFTLRSGGVALHLWKLSQEQDQ